MNIITYKRGIRYIQKSIKNEAGNLNINSELLFNEFVDFIKNKYNINDIDLKKISTSKEIKIPLSIFNEILGPLESIVKHLKEDVNLSYDEIAKILYRNKGPIIVTYRNSIKKLKSKLDIQSDFFIPVSIFSNLKLSILEIIVKYLKEELNLNYHNIAVLLKRDDRTIWTVYNRSLKKNV